MAGRFGSGMKMDRRTLLKFSGAAGLAAAGMASLSGCSGSGGSSGSSSGGTIKMLYFGQQSAATALQKALQPKLKKIDSSANLEVTGINGTDWNDFVAKVLTQIAAGSTPDVVSVATEGLQQMASKNLIIPLDSYVTKDMSSLKSSYFDDVHPAIIEAMMYQGHLWELADNFNAGSMFYSTSLLEKAGLAAPPTGWTMDQFHEYAVKLAKLGSNVNAFDWVVRLWGSWTSFMYANNANLLEMGKYTGGDWLWNKAYAGDAQAKGRSGGFKWGQPTANSAATVEALDYVVQMQKDGLSPSPDVGGGGTLQGLFASGRIGMTIAAGFWAGGLHNAGMKNGSFDVQLFPTWKSNRTLFGTQGYGIFNASKKKDLAWEVVKMLVEPTSFDLVYPGNVTTPARKSLLTAERYRTTGPEHWQRFYQQLDNSLPISAPPYYQALATSLNQRTTQAIASHNAKAALDGMQQDLETAAKSA